MGKFVAFVVFMLVAVISITTAEPAQPNARISKSEVRIAVGETPNFLYRIYGVTFSNDRISVSGDYFNDEYNQRGSANLFLGAYPDVYRFWFQLNPGNQIGIDVQNSFGSTFHYDVLVPPSVPAEILRPEPFNYTALIIRAPSRSSYYGYPRISPVGIKSGYAGPDAQLE